MHRRKVDSVGRWINLHFILDYYCIDVDFLFELEFYFIRVERHHIGIAFIRYINVDYW